MTEKVVILALYLVGTNCMAYMFLDTEVSQVNKYQLACL